MSNTEYFHSPEAHEGGGGGLVKGQIYRKGEEEKWSFGDREVSVVDLILKDQEKCRL